MKTIQQKILRITKLKLVYAVLLTATALWAQPYVRQYRTARMDFVPGEVIVKYRDYVSTNTALYRSQSVSDGYVHVLANTPADQGPMHLLKSLRGMSVQEAIANISQNPDVEYVQPNYIYHTLVAPNDTDYGQLWGLKNSAQTVASATYATNNPGTSGRDIDAESAWNTITDCSSTVVAVIDTGVNYTHTDLSTNIVNGSYTCPGGTGSRGCDFVGTGDADPMDFNGHGTHVAGTIGAIGNNATGTTGVCWTAQILAVRVLDASGSGTTADIVEGVNFAVATGAGNGNAKVINMSLGGPTFDSAFNTALTTAATNDVVVVVAAGNATQNHNTTASYPCDYAQSNIICVAAVDQSYSIASFSDFDTNSTAANRKVDIGAPGTNIKSSYFGTSTTISDNFNTAGTLNWTTSPSGNWAYTTCLGPDSIISPTGGFCSATVPGNFLSNIIYKNFNLSAYSAAYVSFVTWLDLSQSGDSWAANYKAAGGSPFTSGTNLIAVTGNIHTGGVVSLTYDISSCNTAACTVGFRHVTDGSTNASFDGVLVGSFSITGQTVTTNAYNILNGTSMASPHVAGIATLVRARNPSFTGTDTITAILNGGDMAAALSSNTKTGMVADAFGSLKYIPQTTGVSVSSP